MLVQYVSSACQYPKQLKAPAQHNLNICKESQVDKKDEDISGSKEHK
jgi:hypothetical protein